MTYKSIRPHTYVKDSEPFIVSSAFAAADSGFQFLVRCVSNSDYLDADTTRTYQEHVVRIVPEARSSLPPQTAVHIRAFGEVLDHNDCNQFRIVSGTTCRIYDGCIDNGVAVYSLGSAVHQAVFPIMVGYDMRDGRSGAGAVA